MRNAILFLLNYAKANNLTFEDAARRYLLSKGEYQSAVKGYIRQAGFIPDVGIMEQARQAGYLIMQEAGDKMETYLNLEPGFIPTYYRRYNFYNLANTYPAVFVACIYLSLEQAPVSNFLFMSAEQTEKLKKGAKQAAKFLQEKVKDVKDLAGKVADVGKKVALAPFRGPFLLLVRFNVFNLARELNRAIAAARQETKNMWENEVGGDFAQLVSAVNLGKKEMPILPGKSQTFSGLKYSSLDPVSAGTTATASTPVLAIVKGFLVAIKAKVALFLKTAGGGYLAAELQDEWKEYKEDKKKQLEEETKKAIDDTINNAKQELKGEAKEILDEGIKAGKDIVSGKLNNTSMNLPERGDIKTPFGNLSFNLTNNKADIIKLMIGAVVVVAIFYFMRRK